MRARNIKPGFFKNEQIADLPFEARLLFIGLWCMADREGRLEDRPKRLDAEIFPYDNVNVHKLLDVIALHELIVRFNDNNKQYIQIINFTKHQHPHPNEPKSEIPPMSLVTRDITRATQADVRMLGCYDVRNPDTMNTPKYDFDLIWSRYPRKQKIKEAKRHFFATVKTDQDYLDIQKALTNYVVQCEGVEKRYVQTGATWFNNWREHLNPVDLKSKVSFDELRRGNDGIRNSKSVYKPVAQPRAKSTVENVGEFVTGHSVLSALGYIAPVQHPDGPRDIETDGKSDGQSVG